MNTKLKSFTAVALTALTLMVSSACSGNGFIDALKVAVAAADAAIPVLSITGLIPAPLAPVLTKYVNQAGVAIVAITTEAASTDSAVVKATKINADIASAILPDLSLLPASVAIYFTAIDSALQAVLSQFPMTASNRAAAFLHPHASFSASDLRALADLNKAAQSIVVKTAK